MEKKIIGLVDTIILKKKNQLKENNVKTLMDFDLFNRANKVTECTRYNQTILLMRFITRTKKNFSDVTRKDVEAYLASRKVKASTLDMDKIILKKFYKWLNGGKTYPDCVEWLKLSNNYVYKSSEDMLTEAEIQPLWSISQESLEKAIP
ncbi:MAG: phage integrase N-terminal SAM-like domain-containing protein [Candidatus Thermoplasmatota archaeon]|nr:phage integrase N-terminal SAM-like domain-containing protein [Candidatus Thermoplasmatota archaeon]